MDLKINVYTSVTHVEYKEMAIQQLLQTGLHSVASNTIGCD